MRVAKAKAPHPLAWLFELLESKSEYRQKKMFGMEAAYLGDRICAVIGDGEEPWSGILVPTEREFHSAIQGQWPALTIHPIIKKWLYISQNHPDFEQVATEIIEQINRGDSRLGTIAKPKSKTKKVAKKTKVSKKTERATSRGKPSGSRD